MASGSNQKHVRDMISHAEWEWNFAQVELFLRQRGHADLGNHPAGEWLRQQRHLAAQDKLTADHQRRLLELGVLMEDEADQKWDEMVRSLRKQLDLRQVQKNAARALWLPSREEDARLRDWLEEQRALHREGGLSQARTDQLNRLHVLPPWEEPEDGGAAAIRRSRWEERWVSLVQFYSRFGHCDVPQGWEEDTALASWVKDQRSLHKAGRLPPDLVQRLNDLGFSWDLGQPAKDRVWENRLQELLEYQRSHGHMRVTKKENRPLWHWRHIQREWRRKGMLKPERIARLDAVGFDWNEPGDWSQSRIPIHEQRWEQMFAEAAAFHRQFGHVELPLGRKEHAALAKWLQIQRGKQKRGLLAADRKARLDALGMRWHHALPQAEKRWEYRFAQLLAYKSQHGHTRVTKSQDNQLAHWRHVQREWRKQGRLPPERIAKLDSIGFEWQEPDRWTQSRIQMWDEQWEKMFARLEAFHRRFGHAEVLSNWEEDVSLARWVGDQREKQWSGNMRPDRKARLDALGMRWHRARPQAEKRWEERLNQLLAYKARHGHTRVTKSQDNQLAHWRHVQREWRKQGKLSPERQARLDAIGFEWES